MEHTVHTSWKNGMQFETTVNGHKIILDAGTEMGGDDQGPRPKPLLLSALAGCTGMDVVSMLQKMRVPIDGLNIIITGQLTEEHPKHYSSMHIIYEFRGDNLAIDKLEKAVKLSQESYCGVSFMFRKFLTLTYDIQVVA